MNIHKNWIFAKKKVSMNTAKKLFNRTSERTYPTKCKRNHPNWSSRYTKIDKHTLEKEICLYVYIYTIFIGLGYFPLFRSRYKNRISKALSIVSANDRDIITISIKVNQYKFVCRVHYSKKSRELENGIGFCPFTVYVSLNIHYRVWIDFKLKL